MAKAAGKVAKEPAPPVSLNDEQRLYVIRCGRGFTCFGYDNCYRDAEELARRLDMPELAPDPAKIGTLEQYEGYTRLVGSIGTRDIGTWFTPGTPKPVQDILEAAIRSRQQQKLAITTGDKETGMAWGDRVERGMIGRSMGPMKIPLLCSARGTGGTGLLTDCIVRIQEAGTGRTLYQHPTFHPYVRPPQAADAPQSPSASPRV